MSTSSVTGFPNAPQSTYARIPKAPLVGTLWEEEHWNARPLNGLLPYVKPVAFTKTFTIGNNTPTDVVGVSIDGGKVTVPSGADATATALALSTALSAAGFTSTYFASITPAAAVVTVQGVLGQDPEILPVEEGATTLTIGIVQAAVLQPIVCFGEGVTTLDDGEMLNPHKFQRPSSLTDKLMGVVLRLPGSDLPAGQKAEYDPALGLDDLVPGRSYSIERADVGVMVEYVGDAPTKTDPVYWICTGDNAGKWAKSSGATPKVVTLTAASVADGNIGFSYNGLPVLSLTATANDTDDMTSLYGLFLGSASYLALVDGPGSVVDNLDGTMTITFAEGVDPTFADASTGTSTVAEAVDTPFVAPNAQLIEDYSWAKRTIEASADTPARAYLRLSPS